MNTKLTMLALIEIISALSMGIFILAATYQLLKYVGRKRYGIHQNNQAYSIFMASVLFAIGYTVSSAIQPLISLFRILAMKEASDFSLAMRFIFTGGSYIGMAFVIGAVVCLLGIVVYTYLTPVDEFEELKNNNLAVAIIVGSIVITLSLLTKDGVSLLLESFIPYPEQYPKVMNISDRLTRINHKGKEIIKVDYSNCNEAQLIELTLLHKELVLEENKPCVFLADYANTFGTPDYMSAAKDFTESTRHLVTKGAFLGITGPKVFLLKGITYFINVNFKTFSDEKDALDWLVS